MTITPVSVKDVSAVCVLLEQAEEELASIDLGVKVALSKVAQSVITRSIIMKGRVLLAIREKVSNAEYVEFLQRPTVGIGETTANQWIDCWKISRDYQHRYEVELLETFGSTSLSILSKLPMGLQEEILDAAEKFGEYPTNTSLRDLSKLDRVRLQKLKEEKEKSLKEEEEAVEAFNAVDGKRDAHANPEYRKALNDKGNAKRKKDLLDKKIAKLEAQLELEQAKATSAEASQKAAEEKLDQVLFDEDTAASLQVKRVGYNLQNMVPQVLADLQRFTSERQRYPEELRLHIEDQTRQLLHYLTKHYD